MNELKVYIWKEFSPDYSGGLAVAIASSQEEAEKMITEQYGNVWDWGDLEVHEIGKLAACVGGGG